MLLLRRSKRRSKALCQLNIACGTCDSQKSDYDVFVVVDAVAVAAAAVFVVKVMSLLLLLSLCWIDSNTGRCKLLPFSLAAARNRYVSPEPESFLHVFQESVL